MATCPSGASVKSPLTGDEIVDVSLDSYNTITGTTSHWWDVLFGPFIPHFVKVSDLCALNPDQPVTPDAVDFLAALRGDPYAIQKLTTYWSDLFTYTQFSRNCVCNSPGAFSCTTLLSHPYNPTNHATNVGSSNGMEFVPSSDCWIYGGYLNIDVIGSGNAKFGVVESGGAALSHEENIPSPATGDHAYFFVTPQHLLAGHTYKFYYGFPSATWGIPYAGVNSTPATNSFATYTQAVYANPYGSAWLPVTPRTHATDPIFCPPAGTPPLPDEPVQDPDITLPVTPTCSTTADLCTLLNRLSLRLDWIFRQVNLLQAKAAPFTYLEGTVHSGLTGDGSFTVSAILGYSVSLTTVPSTWGRSSDNPPRYIPAPGSVSIGDTLGDQGADFINNEDQTVIRPEFGVGTTLHYHFKPGVTATITELVGVV